MASRESTEDLYRPRDPDHCVGIRSRAALYTQDAIILPPHGAAVQGREAIGQWLATLPVISSATGEDVEVQGAGDLAYLRGTYTMTVTVPGVPVPIKEVGKFLQIHRRQGDGSWRVSREIDLPLPLPTTASPSQGILRP